VKEKNGGDDMGRTLAESEGESVRTLSLLETSFARRDSREYLGNSWCSVKDITDGVLAGPVTKFGK
jgi:hypothetical protein